MYGGKIVERGSVDEIFYDTAHPYTKGLMHSIAKLDTAKGHKLQPIEGTPPDLFAPPKDVRSQQDVNTAWKSVKICRHRLMSFQKNMKPVAGCSMNMHRIQT